MPETRSKTHAEIVEWRLLIDHLHRAHDRRLAAGLITVEELHWIHEAVAPQCDYLERVVVR